MYEIRRGRRFERIGVISEIRQRQSMRIYLKNNLAKFHPETIWILKRRSLTLFLKTLPQQQQQQQQEERDE